MFYKTKDWIEYLKVGSWRTIVCIMHINEKNLFYSMYLKSILNIEKDVYWVFSNIIFWTESSTGISCILAWHSIVASFKTAFLFNAFIPIEFVSLWICILGRT